MESALSGLKTVIIEINNSGTADRHPGNDQQCTAHTTATINKVKNPALIFLISVFSLSRLCLLLGNIVTRILLHSLSYNYLIIFLINGKSYCFNEMFTYILTK